MDGGTTGLIDDCLNPITNSDAAFAVEEQADWWVCDVNDPAPVLGADFEDVGTFGTLRQLIGGS